MTRQPSPPTATSRPTCTEQLNQATRATIAQWHRSTSYILAPSWTSTTDIINTMGLLSILPASLSAIELWLTRVFLLLAIVTVGPWLLLLAYDLVLYAWRSAMYEFPVYGGRARGLANRPRAPSLTERPSGHRRHISLAGIPRHGPDLHRNAVPTSSDGDK
ncbi:hypothetical protein LTR53_012900 [Teratosphaeriaceae sp. CCFEE 6253]|nr:hypothetical protein LTR53_012900 [Teratosphaeriaceae sp. CCFEE 6253]